MAYQYYVWVLEGFVLNAVRDGGHWEVYDCYNTRSEAVEARDKPPLMYSLAYRRKMFRIRKYVPCTTKGRP